MYDADNDISRIFNTDSREKKRVGIGIHARASRRGYCRGGIRTQSDFLTAKQIKNLSGEVKVTSMFDEYKDLEKCNLEEILKKDAKDITKILTVIKANHSCKKICDKFRISNGKLYGFYDKYGVAYGKRPVSAQVKNNKGRILKIQETVISTERFQLMDSMSKGKYIDSLIVDHQIGMSELSRFWGIAKGSIQYYRKRYLDTMEAREGKNKDAASIPDLLEMLETNEAVEVIGEQATSALSEAASKEAELLRKIAELEEANRKLVDTIANNTVADNSRLSLNIKGEYSKNELSDRLLSIDNITVEGIQYKISLHLEEI